MHFKTLALATSALVAIGLTAATAYSAPAPTPMMGDLNLGFALNWDEFNGFGGESSFDFDTFDTDWQSIQGAGRVNLPYDEWFNIQLDMFGRSSLDQSFFSGKGSNNQVNHFGFGGHLNYRDDVGLLGMFVATGRSNDTFGEIIAPFYMFGLDGQYFCEQWTVRAQLAYMDSDESFLMKEAGVIRVGATFYPRERLKLTGDLAYISGQSSGIFFDFEPDVDQWAWSLAVHYWFGVSIPVSGFAEYRGRNAEVDWGSEGDAELDYNSLNFGVIFHFGGDDFMEADRAGASSDLPDVEWYRLPLPEGAFID